MAVVDETLVELASTGRPVPFAAVARPDLTVTVGTLSKSVWGGLRVGGCAPSPRS